MSEFVNTIDALGDEAAQDALIMGTLTEFKDNKITTLNAGTMDSQPLVTIVLPNITTIPSWALGGQKSLRIADFTNLTSMGTFAFNGTTSMIALILRNEKQVVDIPTSNFHDKLPGITDGSGHIYVPASMVDSYKAHTTWSNLADYFRALEDYTVDGTVTGDLDETKI